MPLRMIIKIDAGTLTLTTKCDNLALGINILLQVK
jgi:hypothetical protein